MKRILSLAILFLSGLLLPSYSNATDNVSKITLNNQSKPSDLYGGYYFEQDKIFGDPSCEIVYRGDKKVMPGNTTYFEVKKQCPWAGVSFKVHKVKNDQYVGVLSYSLRDGSLAMEMKTTCKNNSECTFIGAMPENKNKMKNAG